ncbi:type VI secretion system baseplate subunit TssG [Polyangium sp. 15x6]|uniref:type VI secretion system baseplate subunit TssG n=1 Tax=Polyangium sp. 15x6 TaxID=3042687 RepID=UPI00249C8380|nr:type VI secretion system baseplate subunit TssG [Polyangium sp. 15x6]MDI3289177.1 type VI secretion system baseplate subunit TssG [Polyangium sp. 15x6]
MAAHGWRKSPSVEAWLFDEGHAFDFYQAVSLLERFREGDAVPVGEGSDPSRESVRFAGNIALAFPETDVARIRSPHREGEPAKMQVNFLGLGGALGPLPPPIVESIYMRAVRGDTAARDFLDIFNHRLVSFAYRIRKGHRVGLGVSSPEKDGAARHLFALLGLGFQALEGRLAVQDRALLEHAANLSNESRSLEGLVAILRRHFGVPIEPIPLTGAFHPIEETDRTAIGRSGQNRALGRNACLGGRFWDQESTFDLRIGPMKLDEFLRFLPDGDALRPLCSLVRFYAGARFHFSLILVLAEGEAPRIELGRATCALLGQIAWLGNVNKHGGRVREVRLSRAAIRKGLGEAT